MVIPPAFSMTSCILLGMESTRLLRYWLSSILVTQSWRISRFQVSRLVAEVDSDSWFFIQLQQFSMGLRSGEFPSHLMRVMLGLAVNQAVTILAL